jgi:hypothetical protein
LRKKKQTANQNSGARATFYLPLGATVPVSTTVSSPELVSLLTFLPFSIHETNSNLFFSQPPFF